MKNVSNSMITSTMGVMSMKTLTRPFFLCMIVALRFWL
jgi:hypothetical protein